MLMRVVTDFNVFDIGILEIFVFYSLPSCESSLSVDLFNFAIAKITGTTSISDYQRMISACRLHWCLVLQIANNWPLYSTNSATFKVHMLLSVTITALYMAMLEATDTQLNLLSSYF